jgi:hypothetical protein
MAMSNEDLLKELSAKPIMEVVELVKMLEDEWGVSAAAPVAVAAAGAAGGDAGEAAAEKDEFDVVLASFGDDYGSWPQGSQGRGRRRSVNHQGRCIERRGRGLQEAT